MSKTTIKDSRVRLFPNKQLLQLINSYKDEISEIPSNLAKTLKSEGCDVTGKIETLQNSIGKQPGINFKLLKTICEENLSVNMSKIQKKENANQRNYTNPKISEELKILYLTDLRWLNSFLMRLREKHDLNVYLHQFLESSQIILPENEIIERNPELEARCEKLRHEQQNREYMKMTKNVDSALKNYPEDTIAYQMKSLNKQIIAVFQFVLSVVAGFAFGFLGLELIIGGLDFGFRLLMGIMFALIIALAEIYFLAKKLNEYDEVTETVNNFNYHHSPSKNRKPHMD